MMLKRLVNLDKIESYSLEAVDGSIGKFEDIFFDDDCFAVRYLVVNTNGLLLGRKVLLSPFTLGEVNEEKNQLYIELNKEQIENSPPVESNQPVSREYEMEYFNYYGWPAYWENPMWPPAPSNPPTGLPATTHGMGNLHSLPAENHLRSCEELHGYTIAANDGNTGQAISFIIDTHYWLIRYLEIDTHKWLPGGKHRLINTAWISSISWPDHKIGVDLSRRDLQNAPQYDRNKALSREDELQLFNYYGKETYWR